MQTLSAHRAGRWLRLLLVSLLCAACGSGVAPSVRLLQPAHAAVLGESGRPIIQMGLLQYFNPAGRAFNYSGYELDAMGQCPIHARAHGRAVRPRLRMRSFPSG